MLKAILYITVVVLVLIGARWLVGQAKEDTLPKGTNGAPRKGTFSVLQGEVQGHPFVAMIDVGLRNFANRQGLPFFLSISAPLVRPTDNGLPSRDDADDLNAWEDSIEAGLQPASKFVFVGRVTSNGNRELLYYVENQKSATAALNRLSGTHSTRPFAFRCTSDEKWESADFWLKHK